MICPMQPVYNPLTYYPQPNFQQLYSATQPVPAQYAELYAVPEQPGYVPVMAAPKIVKTGNKLEKKHDRWYNMNEIVVENIMQTAL